MTTTSPCDEALPALMCTRPIRFEGMGEGSAQYSATPVKTELVQQLQAVEATLRKRGNFESRANVNCYIYAGWVWPETLCQRVTHKDYIPSRDFEQFVQETHAFFEENRVLN